MSFATLDTAFQILNIFLAHERPMMAKEIAKLTNLSRSGLYKYLASLKDHRYLEYSEEKGTYRLGFKFLEFGRCVQLQLQIYEIAKPLMEAMHREVGNVVILSALSGNKSYCVGRVGDEDSGFVYVMQPGLYMPLHCGATSLILLANLDDAYIKHFIQTSDLKKYTDNTVVEPVKLWERIHQIRAEGCCYSDREIGIGCRAIAAPIFDHFGAIHAGLCIIGPIYNITDNKVDSLKKTVIRYAKEINRKFNPVSQMTD